MVGVARDVLLCAMLPGLRDAWCGRAPVACDSLLVRAFLLCWRVLLLLLWRALLHRDTMVGVTRDVLLCGGTAEDADDAMQSADCPLLQPRCVCPLP
jgi:hypothetical protein